MSPEEAEEFARQWVSAWNDHDVERVLSHFADDVEFASPVIPTVLPGSPGVVVGKDALRRYWQAGINRIPDLHFELVGVYVGVGALVIHYRNQKEQLVCEVLELDDTGVVVRGFGCYTTENPGGS